jgi:hypothetical protein
MPAGIKTGNFATDWLIDRISNSATKNPETGKMEAGFFEGIAGSAFGLDNELIETTKENNINNQAANNLLEANGLTRSELGIGENANITTGLVGSKTREYNEKKLTDKEDKVRGQQVDDRTAGYKHANDTLAATLQSQTNASNAALTSQQNQFAHTSEMSRLDRGLERELSSNNQEMQMAIAQMNADLSDKAYGLRP